MIWEKKRVRRRARLLRRWDVINELIAKRPAPTSFLEVGVRAGECGALVRADRKVGVDPEPQEAAFDKYAALHVETSDDFFKHNEECFDVVFIDGLHTQAQAMRDVEGAAGCLKAGGYIVMHDSNPPDYAHQATPSLTGDVWKAVVDLRRLPHFDTYTVGIETGVTVVQLRANEAPLTRAVEDYSALEAHRIEALRIIDPYKWLKRA